MIPVRRFFEIDRRDRALLVEAGALLAVIRIAQWIISFPMLVAMTRNLPVPIADSGNRMAWAIHHAARVVPRATCLTKALALQQMMLRAGRPSTVQLGVAKATGGFEFHAWVESNGQPLLNSAEETARYSRLFTLQDSP
jgi:hypothetical protein